jgi:hypothetical protein
LGKEKIIIIGRCKILKLSNFFSFKNNKKNSKNMKFNFL